MYRSCALVSRGVASVDADFRPCKPWDRVGLISDARIGPLREFNGLPSCTTVRCKRTRQVPIARLTAALRCEGKRLSNNFQEEIKQLYSTTHRRATSFTAKDAILRRSTRTTAIRSRQPLASVSEIDSVEQAVSNVICGDQL